MEKQSIIMIFNDKKRHSVRFDALKEEKTPLLQSVYVMNKAFDGNGDIPSAIKVTIEEVPEGEV